MRIDRIIIPWTIADKLAWKHNVLESEVDEVLYASPRIRFAQKGRTKGDDVYVAFGQTYGSRYLAIYFVYKRLEKIAIVISARDMSNRERKQYGRK